MRKRVSVFALCSLFVANGLVVSLSASEIEPVSPTLETCAGDVWRTKASNVTKSGIIHPSFGTVKRKVSAYQIPAKSSVNVSIGGYGVSVSLGSGTAYTTVPANINKYSTITMTVRGDVQQKQNNSCVTQNRFVKKYEQGVVKYY